MITVISFLSAVPLLFFLLPLIVDMATGEGADEDIIVRRPHSKEDISL
jgi:hypothetical protein